MRVIEGSTAARTYPCIVYYQDARGEWRWSLYARNKRMVAEGGEGYAGKAGVKRSIRGFANLVGLAAIGSKALKWPK